MLMKTLENPKTKHTLKKGGAYGLESYHPGFVLCTFN